MATTNFCYFRRICEYCSDAIKSICRNRHTYTSSANQDPSFRLSSEDAFTNLFCVIREIIERFDILCSNILYNMSEIFQVVYYIFLERKTPMITCKSNYHIFLYLLSSPSIYPIIGSQNIHIKYSGLNSHKDTNPNTEA